MKNKSQKRIKLSIRQKMLASYLVLVAVIMLLGVIGLESLYRVYTNGNTIYYHHMQAVAQLKSVSQNLREIDRNLVILSSRVGHKDDAEYRFMIRKLQTENEQYLHEYEQLTTSDMENRRYRQCRLSVMSFNKQVDRVMEMTEIHHNEHTLYATYEQELAPTKVAAFEIIDATVELALRNAEVKNVQNEQIFTKIIIAVNSIALLAILAAITIAVVMSRYFTRRFDSIQQLARRMGEYDISDNLKELPQDELGDTMRALNDSQFMIRDFMDHIVSETDEMGDMGKDISDAIRHVKNRIQEENIQMLKASDHDLQTDPLVKEIMGRCAGDERVLECCRELLEMSHYAREARSKGRATLANLTMVLEQIAITSDHQNEIVASHRMQVSRFKTKTNEPKQETD